LLLHRRFERRQRAVEIAETPMGVRQVESGRRHLERIVQFDAPREQADRDFGVAVLEDAALNAQMLRFCARERAMRASNSASIAGDQSVFLNHSVMASYPATCRQNLLGR
jgi:hypothetical protein